MESLETLAVKPTQAADALNIGRSKVYELIADGTIPSIKVGGCIRVPVAALRALIAGELETRKVG